MPALVLELSIDGCSCVLAHAPVVLLGAKETVNEDDGRILGLWFCGLVKVIGKV